MKVIKVLFLAWEDLPDTVTESLLSLFEDDGETCRYTSELEPEPGQDWGTSLTQKTFDEFFKEANEDGDTLTKEDFLDEFGLELDHYLLTNKVDLTGVEEIIITR